MAEIRSFTATPREREVGARSRLSWSLRPRGPRSCLKRLRSEYEAPLPQEIETYIADFLPAERHEYRAPGTPITLVGHRELSAWVDGYSWDPLTEQPIDGWGESWLLIGAQGLEPMVIDLAEPETPADPCPVWQGTGSALDFRPIADSLGQFLLLAAGLDHALHGFAGEAIIEDERGYNLAPAPARWLFPRFVHWAPSYYNDWLSVFDNA